MAGTFDYVKYDPETTERSQALKAIFEETEKRINELVPDSRGKSLAKTHLEESFMWCGKALRDWQVKKGGDAAHQPSRTNE